MLRRVPDATRECDANPLWPPLLQNPTNSPLARPLGLPSAISVFCTLQAKFPFICGCANEVRSPVSHVL